MKPTNRIPIEVYKRAHVEYPSAVGAKRLYGVAFFGHAPPGDLAHRETCESIWRGLVRKHLVAYAKERSAA